MTQKQQKIQNLLDQRAKTKARLKKIQEFWKEEKDNEEAWPGHETNTYQLAENQLDLLLSQLAEIESELKALGYKENKK